MSEPVQFPLAAVVGADDLKLALCLTAIDPKIGGVLIEGPRGMAKSTLARGLADLLGEGPFVTLPLGASEERLVGTLDLDAALGQGKAQFSPGVLAQADGGVLYVDEVNLLPDTLVDLLLDVAASGTNRIERDGISHRHNARFVLIGTMNPEEGELRPQLLDRFGLNVALEGLPEPEARQQIIRRRLAFDSDPKAFCDQWATAQAQLRERCQAARQALAQIALDDQALAWITERCYAAGVDGLRADLVWLRAARAHCAWRGAAAIEEVDVEAVAEFALRHRRRVMPQAKTPSAPQPPDQQPGQPGGGNPGEQGAQGDWGGIAGAAGGQRRTPRGTELGKKALSIPQLPAKGADARPGAGKQGEASRGRGRNAAAGRVAWLPTLLKGRPRLRQDLCWQQRQARPAELWLVIVDASASTRRHQALAQTKGLLAALFDQAYRQRARLALLTASGRTPQWQRHGLKASAALQPWLQALGAGGGTPLICALEQARHWLQARQRAYPDEAVRCLVFTDGRLQRWDTVQPMPCATLLVDMELAPVRVGRAQHLAEQLQADYQHLQHFKVVD